MRTASSRILALTAVVLLTGIAAADVYTCDSQLAHQPASGGAVEDPELSPRCSLLRDSLLSVVAAKEVEDCWAQKLADRDAAAAQERKELSEQLADTKYQVTAPSSEQSHWMCGRWLH